ncbi:hypothetical protein AAC387_Pa04g1038 [Persea americana]
MGERFLEVTYAELLKATDGFSSASLIGVGSLGFVYKGFLDQVGLTAAIKVVKLQQQRASKSFIAECKALRSIRHRNIVKILSVCSSIDFTGNDFKALVFEYMPNGSLDTWLHPNEDQHNSTCLNLIQRLNVAIDVASALNYLHHYCEAPLNWDKGIYWICRPIVWNGWSSFYIWGCVQLWNSIIGNVHGKETY